MATRTVETSIKRKFKDTTMTPDFTISQMTVVDGKPSVTGIRLLAHFDLSIIGMQIKGCIMTQGPEGTAAVFGPSGKANYGGRPIAAKFGDPALTRAVMRRAATLYENFTGRVVEAE